MKKNRKALAGAPAAPAPPPALPPGTKTIPISKEQAGLLAQLNRNANEASNVLASAVNTILAGKGVTAVVSDTGLGGTPAAPLLLYLGTRRRRGK